MRRIPSQDQVVQGGGNTLHARLRHTVAAAGRSSISLASCNAFGSLSQHVRSAQLARLSNDVLPGLMGLCSRAPGRQTLSKAANGFYGMLTAQRHVDESQDAPTHLDWRPQLSFLQEALCFSAAALFCCGFYALTAPATISLVYGALIALLCSSIIGALRYSLLEAMYRAGQRQVSQLGDPDSRFRQLQQLLVHVKCQDAAPSGSAPDWGIHCYHGFGSNYISWSLVQAPLAQQLRAVVTAHDMPGFGLTARPSDLEQYFLDFNGRLGLSVLGHELAQRAAEPAAGTAQQGQRPEASDTTQPADQLAHSTVAEQQQLSSTKVVLVGHSMGGACAALATLEKPEQVAALVLVAPAIFALPGRGRERGMLVHERSRSLAPAAEEQTSFEQPAAARSAAIGNRAASASSLAGSDDGNEARAEDGAGALGRQDSATSLGMASPDIKASKQQAQGSGTATGPQEHVMVLQMHPEEHAPAPPPPKVPGRAQLLAKAATSAAQAVAAACVLAAIMVLKPLIVLLLRMVVRSKSFWERGLASAYYDSSKLTAEVVDAYRMPQLVRGWEDGMLQFVLARLAGASRLGKLGFGRKPSRAGSASGSGTDVSASNTSSASGIMMVRDAVSEGLRPAALGSAGAGAATAAAAAADPEGSLADQLAAVVEKHRIPVLLVHGEGDRIVPISNSKRLAKRLPGCKLSVYMQCGHMPQEELPEGFVATVKGFLQEVAAGAGKKRL